MYNNGQGVRPNPVAAYMWFSLSAAAGDGVAAEMRNLVAQRLAPEQVAEAQRLARERQKTHKKQWRDRPHTPPLPRPAAPHELPGVRPLPKNPPARPSVTGSNLAPAQSMQARLAGFTLPTSTLF